jgi:hypothetical protein
MSSLDTFISGQSVVTAFGDHVPTNTHNNDLVHQYEEVEEEEEEDEIENAPDHVSIKLAERTSSLINSFNEYIADLSDRDEEMMLGNSDNSRNNIDWSERTQDIGIVKLDWSERTDDMVDRMNNDWSDRSGLSGMSGGLSDSIIERMTHIPGSDSYTVSPTTLRVPPLLRDWNDPNMTASNLSALAMKHKSNAYNEDDSSYEEKKYHYTHNNYKRVKRVGVGGVIVLIVTLIAIIVPSSKRRLSGNTTTPSALRKEEKKTELVSLLLEQEQNDHEEGEESVASTIDNEEEAVQSLYASAFSNTVHEVEEDFDITSGLVQETFVPAKESSFNPVIRPGPEYFIEEEKAESSTVESNVDDTILLVHNQFKPIWLSSKEGWNGGSYDDALALCSSFREPKQLCPYSVMCPHGPGGAIMGGLHQLELNIEGEQYAPVMGGKNHWVMIGNVSIHNDDGTMIESKDKNMSTCQTHRQFHGKNPDWGFNGDRRELKQYIMCCTVDTM